MMAGYEGIVWYTVVGYGGTGGCPRGPWYETDCITAITRWYQRQPNAGSIVAQHSLRVLAYRTRDLARRGDISDGPGKAGCVGMWPLEGFGRTAVLASRRGDREAVEDHYDGPVDQDGIDGFATQWLDVLARFDRGLRPGNYRMTVYDHARCPSGHYGCRCPEAVVGVSAAESVSHDDLRAVRGG